MMKISHVGNINSLMYVDVVGLASMFLRNLGKEPSSTGLDQLKNCQ